MHTDPHTRSKQGKSTTSLTQKYPSNSDVCLQSRFGNLENECSIDKLKKGSIGKKQFYTPNPQKGKAKSSQTLSSRQRVSNGDISCSSMNISSESIEGEGKIGRRGERTKKNQTMDENINIMGLTYRKKLTPRQADKIDHHPHSQNYFPDQNRQKKSYRKMQSKKVHTVPFRKSHSLLEEKIVVLINKLQTGKDCEKQIKSLNDKLKKVSARELLNKYIVSGILVVCRLAEQYIPSYVLNPLYSTFKDIEQRIHSQLDRIDGFVHSDEVLEDISKEKLVKRIYKLLRKKGGQNLRTESIRIVGELLDGGRVGKRELLTVFGKNI